MLPQTSERHGDLGALLRRSLQDVLSEVNDKSLGPMAGGNAPTFMPSGSPALKPTQSNFGQHQLASFFQASTSPSASFATSHTRSNAMLGMSSLDLFLAAAAEKRMMEQRYVRQRALEETLERHRKNQSLLGLFHRGMGSSGANRHPLAFNLPAKQEEPPKDPLKEIGSSLRNKTAPYVDVSSASDPDPNDTTVKKTRGGVTEPFPEKLHRLLKEIEDDGNGDAISFFSHGRAFGIHDTDKFVNDVMPKYFKQSRLSSFQRQLNLYGFKRITSGPDAGGYYHELFLKGRPNLCLHMRRVGLPKGEDRRKMRSKDVQVNPDFYSMRPVNASS